MNGLFLDRFIYVEPTAEKRKAETELESEGILFNKFIIDGTKKAKVEKGEVKKGKRSRKDVGLDKDLNELVYISITV